MIAHVALPTATIDITHHTTLDIGIGTGDEIIVEIILIDIIYIIHGTDCSCRIDILADNTAQQFNIGSAIHIAAIGKCVGTQSATVCIADHLGAFHDTHIRIVCLP